MKNVIALLGLLVLIHAAVAQSVEDQVWKLVTDLDQTLVNKDSMRLKTLLAEDFVGTVPTGNAYRKDKYIRFHCVPNAGLVQVNNEGQMKAIIRNYGSSVIVNRKVTVLRKSPDGSMANLQVQRTEVFVLQQGKWLLAAGHGTELTSPR